MGKGLARDESPGASAAAEGSRARRTARRHGRVSAALALAAAVLVAGGVSGNGWLAVGGGVAAFGAWWWRPTPDPDRWYRGAAGERATAATLARLPRRFVVLHDRHQAGCMGNLDHVVIGPSGVWVIDSKVRRARLRVHRGEVWAGRHPVEVAAAAGQAARLQDALGVPVSAIVAVHGTGLHRRGKKVGGVRVVPAHRLIRLLRRGRRLPSSAIVALAARADQVCPRC